MAELTVEAGEATVEVRVLVMVLVSVEVRVEATVVELNRTILSNAHTLSLSLSPCSFAPQTSWSTT